MKLFGSHKGRKMVKSKKKEEVENPSHLLRCDSNCCVSLSEYPNGDAGNTSADEVSIYEWSVDDNISAPISNKVDASESVNERPIQNSMSESVSLNNPDPLEDIVPLCLKDAPVKSPLQSSTMRLDINQSHEHSDTLIPNNRRRNEERSGPVDVDEFLEYSSTEQSECVPQPTVPLHQMTSIDAETKNRKKDLLGIELSMNNIELRETEVELCYSISSGFPSCCGSEDGDSLRNLGDENVEHAYNYFRRHSAKSLENRLLGKKNVGLASWLLQGRGQYGDGRAAVTRNMLPPTQQLQLASSQTDTQNKTFPRRDRIDKVIKTGSNQGKAKLSQRKSKRKKSLRRHVITTFQTLLRPNNQNIIDKKKNDDKCDLSPRKAYLKKQLSLMSMIPMTGDENIISRQNSPLNKQKPDLNRGLSQFSTTPMTGDTVIDFPDTLKLQNTKEMLLERQRRQTLEYNQQRRQEEKKEFDREQQLYNKNLEAVGVGKGNTTLTPTIIAKVKANRDRQKLQNWVMGCSNLTMEEHPEEGSSVPSALPWLCDSKRVVVGGSSVNDASTALVDNTLPNPNNLLKCREELKKIETTLSDELSSASTPEAVSPSLQITLCVVCNKRKRTHLAIPCMHFSYCEDCVARLEKKNIKACEVCNEKNITFSKLRF